MNEASARQVVLLQAFETGPGHDALWTAQDSAWASRAALESAGPQAAADHFVAERARHALQRLAPRQPAVAAWLNWRVWRAQWWVWAVLVGGTAGLLADAIGSGQRINLLAPPVWGVVVWNLAVYALLGWGAVRAVGRVAFKHGGAQPDGQPDRRARDQPDHQPDDQRDDQPGRALGMWARVLQRLQQWGSGGKAAGNATALQAFTATWARRSAPLSAARASGLLHTAAAALGAGLLAGMYLRGMVLDYRAGWESTFLNAGQVHAALSWLLAPALGLSGTVLPDAAALEVLRFSPDHAVAGASAAPWIHWYALTLLLFVVVPRAALALWSGLRARGLAQHFPLPLADGYFQRLLRHQHGNAARVQVLPYAQAPGPQAELGLRAVFSRLYGEAAHVHVAPVVAFGAEEALADQVLVPPATTLAVALFDLTATPEAENQGRFVALLQQPPLSQMPGLNAASVSAFAVVLVVDEAAFIRRFGPSSDRLAQRREAWRALALSLGTVAVCVDLRAPDLPAAERALQAALNPAALAVTAR